MKIRAMNIVDPKQALNIIVSATSNHKQSRRVLEHINVHHKMHLQMLKIPMEGVYTKYAMPKRQVLYKGSLLLCPNGNHRMELRNRQRLHRFL